MTRVLVVDDEIDTLNLLRTILEISGYEAFTTLNSMDAITLAEIERPDCILLDIMMPHLDGFTLCKMMRLHPSTANLPIVFVTAYSALDLEDRRRDAGADMVLPKPIGMDVLIETVEKATTMRPSQPPPSPTAPAVQTPADIAKQISQLRPQPIEYGKLSEPRPAKSGPIDIDVHPTDPKPPSVSSTSPAPSASPAKPTGNTSANLPDSSKGKA